MTLLTLTIYENHNVNSFNFWKTK